MTTTLVQLFLDWLSTLDDELGFGSTNALKKNGFQSGPCQK